MIAQVVQKPAMGGAVGDDVVLEVERDGARRTVRFAREVAR
mgnify:CR=1 FL=1